MSAKHAKDLIESGLINEVAGMKSTGAGRGLFGAIEKRIGYLRERVETAPILPERELAYALGEINALKFVTKLPEGARELITKMTKGDVL